MVAAALKEIGHTQTSLAFRWGCSRTTARRVLGLDVEPGKTVDHTARRREIAKLLDVPYADLAAAWTKAAA